jgi:hypothetical protein
MKSAAMKTTEAAMETAAMAAKPTPSRRDSWRQQTNCRHRE